MPETSHVVIIIKDLGALFVVSYMKALCVSVKAVDTGFSKKKNSRAKLITTQLLHVLRQFLPHSIFIKQLFFSIYYLEHDFLNAALTNS